MKKIITTIAITFIAFALTACQDNRGCIYNDGKHTLACPEKTYATVNIGGKLWMAENLAVYSPDFSTCYLLYLALDAAIKLTKERLSMLLNQIIVNPVLRITVWFAAQEAGG